MMEQEKGQSLSVRVVQGCKFHVQCATLVGPGKTSAGENSGGGSYPSIELDITQRNTV